MTNPIMRMLNGFLSRKTSAETAPHGDDGAEEDMVGEEIVRRVAMGYEGRDEIVSAILDVFEEDDLDTDYVGRRVDAEIARHAELEASWIEPTDCDRLDAAFAHLEEQGIVARQNFTCCGTCGVAEIGDEFEDVEARGIQVIGYTFFHAQDAEGAADGQGVYLSYGSTARKATGKDHLAIATRIAEVLQAQGLEVEWDGSLSKRIFVKMEWRRRRSGLD